MRLPLRILPAAPVFALALASAGCVPYPVYKTLQPEARLTVLDEAERPVADARVVLISSAYPYGRERFRNETRSAADGAAAFPAIREWRAESMMLHGAQTYFWNWCVEKTGYETYETMNREPDGFEPRAQVRLRAGESRSCNSAQPPLTPRPQP